MAFKEKSNCTSYGQNYGGLFHIGNFDKNKFLMLIQGVSSRQIKQVKAPKIFKFILENTILTAGIDSRRVVTMVGFKHKVKYDNSLYVFKKICFVVYSPFPGYNNG